MTQADAAINAQPASGALDVITDDIRGAHAAVWSRGGHGRSERRAARSGLV